MSFVDRVDAFQRRHPVVGFPLAVIYKFFDDQGPYLSALITYYGFLSAFPLLLLFSSVLGFVLQNNPDPENRVLESVLSQFPVIGTQLKVSGLHGDITAIVIGALVAVYGALGIAQAIQNATNACWAVPRNRRPNPFAARARSLLMIVTAGLLVLGTTAASSLVQAAGDFGLDLGSWGGTIVILASLLINIGVFLLLYRIGTAHPVRRREMLPAAIAAACWWQLVQYIGSSFVNSYVLRTSDTYGTFSLVLGILGWCYLAAVGLVMSIEIAVVLAKHLYPRALLTIFTDDVDLTEADKDFYSDLVRANQLKGFQQVDVSFEKPIADLEKEAQPMPALFGEPDHTGAWPLGDQEAARRDDERIAKARLAAADEGLNARRFIDRRR